VVEKPIATEWESGDAASPRSTEVARGSLHSMRGALSPVARRFASPLLLARTAETCRLAYMRPCRAGRFGSGSSQAAKHLPSLNLGSRRLARNIVWVAGLRIQDRDCIVVVQVEVNVVGPTYLRGWKLCGHEGSLILGLRVKCFCEEAIISGHRCTASDNSSREPNWAILAIETFEITTDPSRSSAFQATTWIPGLRDRYADPGLVH
jgi:hypothetical protein